jgi:hypothetical protein
MKVVITVDVPDAGRPLPMELFAAMHAGALAPLQPFKVESSLELYGLGATMGQATKESKEGLSERFEQALQYLKLRQAVSSVDKFCGSMIDTGKLAPEVADTLQHIRKILSGEAI